jgi:hypothetical protein
VGSPARRLGPPGPGTPAGGAAMNSGDGPAAEAAAAQIAIVVPPLTGM